MGGPHNKDYRIMGSTLGSPPLLWETTSWVEGLGLEGFGFWAEGLGLRVQGLGCAFRTAHKDVR